MRSELSRGDFLKTLAALVVAGGAAPDGVAAPPRPRRPDAGHTPPQPDEVTLEDLAAVEKVAALAFTEEERRPLLQRVRRMRRGYAAMRERELSYTVEPPWAFLPLGRDASRGSGTAVAPLPPAESPRPASEEDLAFASIDTLARLVRTRSLSPVELTKLFLARLERHGPRLLCVVTTTPETALAEARRAEAEIVAGRYRGPLHGIPYGLKDLFATRGVPTTWGAAPFRGRVLDHDAAVVERLRRAGAVLVAKLALGALAQGDVWFKGRTRNPWNPSQGSSGSSAGSAAATAAGLVPFAIGTETLGSIVSPSARCRVTGLRPTYGRVSRYGSMAVSWTMDKIGPLCRSARDCAHVLAAIAGADPRDPSAVDRPFEYTGRTEGLRVGFLTTERGGGPDPAEREDLRLLRGLGLEPRPVTVDRPPGFLRTILTVEASAAFDAFTRGDAIDGLRDSSWPLTYRSGRYVTAVEYLRAQRIRRLVQEQLERELGDVDVLLARGRGRHLLPLTNYTGHPQVLLPFGGPADGPGRSLSLFGRLHGEADVLAVANAIQQVTDHHLRRPELR